MGVSATRLELAGARERSNGRTSRATVAAAMTTVAAAINVLVASGIVPSQPPEAGRPIALSWPGIACSAALVATGWLSVADHPLSSLGLSLVSLGWLLPALAAWPALPAQLRAALLAAAPLAIGGCALVAAGWRLHPGPLRALARTVIGLAAGAAVVHLVGYNPFFDPACVATCEPSRAFLSTALGAQRAFAVIAVLSAVASIAAIQISLQSRAAPTVVRVAGALSATALGLAVLVHWWRWGEPASAMAGDRFQTVGTAVMAGAALLAVARASQLRRQVRSVLGQLAGSAPVGGMAGSVTAVHYTGPDDGRWVDATGHQLDNLTTARTAVLSDVDGAAVRLVLSRRADPDEVVSGIRPAERLALENARLRAAGLARLADLQASQRRIVEVADSERRRIERDLHDGAQQRLVAVMIRLSSGQIRSGGTPSAHLSAGETNLRRTLASLRDLSNESPAAVLAALGLVAAVEESAASLPLDVDVAMAFSEQHLPSAVQVAAYLTIREGLDNVVEHSGNDHAQLELLEERDELVVTVADQGRGGAYLGRGLAALADRVGALGGRLELVSTPGDGTTLTVRLPCVS
jgi:signal transduction histidine kinase